MGRKLVIAEKPSVASDIARALGGCTKHKDRFENEHYVITSAVGHLVEIAPPEGVEAKRGKWTFAKLPVIPEKFDLLPIKKTADRLKQISRLIKSKDIDTLINACDAGREGELIFQYIAKYNNTKKPIARLWLQSMTPQAIREGFARLRPDNVMHGLRDAAMCRSESDWLVGINGTRTMTAFNSQAGGFYLTTVGRVQTPTLALVVDREYKIRAFTSRDYWHVFATIKVAAGEYTARWLNRDFKKNDQDEFARAERIFDKAQAEEIVTRCAPVQPAIIEEEAKPTKQASPLLFDLTSLQREANSRFGFAARTTLSVAQSLYERHKLITYPRTDSRALPEDYIDTTQAVMAALAKRSDHLGQCAAQPLEKNWIKKNKRIFDNSKVSDHFAIIPTAQTVKSLNENEQKIYELIVKRFIAIFYPSAEYLVTTRISQIGQDYFKNEGKVLRKPGWLTVYGRDQSDKEGTLVPVAPGEQGSVIASELTQLATKPPARYSEATLLSAMEGAGKILDDEELRDAMQDKGLGTPATRAQIIENLISEKYMIRDGRELIPMAKAFSLMTLLKGLNIAELSSPELTGEWESRLAQVERGELAAKKFMEDISQMVRKMVESAKTYDSTTIPGDFGVLQTPCPLCQGVVKETYRQFKCEQCTFAVNKVMGSREFEAHEVETLITTSHIGPLEGFRSRQGRPFTAEIIRDGADVRFDFGNDQQNEAVEDFSQLEAVGVCPKCGEQVYAHNKSYICQNKANHSGKCDFSSGQTILSQSIDTEQIQKLLTTGSTDLLKGFVSTRTRRPFSAYLVYDAKAGKIGFKFEPRKSKNASAKAK